MTLIAFTYWMHLLFGFFVLDTFSQICPTQWDPTGPSVDLSLFAYRFSTFFAKSLSFQFLNKVCFSPINQRWVGLTWTILSIDYADCFQVSAHGREGLFGCYWAIYVCLALGSTQTLTEIVCWCRLFLKLCVSDLLGRLRATQCWFECLVACLDAGGLSKYEYVVCLCVWSLNKGWTSSHLNSTVSLSLSLSRSSFFHVDMDKR